MRKNPSAVIDLTGVEFLAPGDPDIEIWALTETGLSCVEKDIFPPNIGVKGPGALRIIKVMGTVETDNMAGYLTLTAAGAKRLMNRLAHHGLVGHPS